MALPLMGAMIGAQVLNSVVGGVLTLVTQHKNEKMQKEALHMMKDQQQWQRAQLNQAFGQVTGQGYPQMG